MFLGQSRLGDTGLPSINFIAKVLDDLVGNTLGFRNEYTSVDGTRKHLVIPRSPVCPVESQLQGRDTKLLAYLLNTGEWVELNSLDDLPQLFRYVLRPAVFLDLLADQEDATMFSVCQAVSI